MTTTQQLAEVQSIIREVTGYTATVAGGAVRDLRLGKPVKDIDVFIPRNRDEELWEDQEQRADVRAINAALTQIGAEPKSYRTSSEKIYTDADEQVYATYEVDTDYGTVNLIFVSDLEAALNEFPDTLAQAMLLDDGTPYYSDEFELSVLHGVVLHRLGEDTKRLPRMREKFPEYSWAHVDEVGADGALEWA